MMSLLSFIPAYLVFQIWTQHVLYSRVASPDETADKLKAEAWIRKGAGEEKLVLPALDSASGLSWI